MLLSIWLCKRLHQSAAARVERASSTHCHFHATCALALSGLKTSQQTWRHTWAGSDCAQSCHHAVRRRMAAAMPAHASSDHKLQHL